MSIRKDLIEGQRTPLRVQIHPDCPTALWAQADEGFSVVMEDRIVPFETSQTPRFTVLSKSALLAISCSPNSSVADRNVYSTQVRLPVRLPVTAAGQPRGTEELRIGVKPLRRLKRYSVDLVHACRCSEVCRHMQSPVGCVWIQGELTEI